MYLAEAAEKAGAMQDIKLRVGLFGAEGSTEEMRAELERRWGIIATENYGLTEVMGPGVSGECEYKKGMHINEDHFLCEIIDPQTGEVLPDGAEGEMVITTLSKFAMPMIRYRTRDITRIITEPCECGRTTLRMEKCKGRSDDMLIIRGVNVFPSQIESALLGVSGIGPHYEIVVTRENYMDKIEVRVELYGRGGPRQFCRVGAPAQPHRRPHSRDLPAGYGDPLRIAQHAQAFRGQGAPRDRFAQSVNRG